MEYTKHPLRSLSVEQLKELRSQIASELNYRDHMRLMENKSSIQVGDTVIVNHAKTNGKTFRVTSMRRTKASIQNINNTRESYSLPISMMQIA
jgi:hypothetical protein